VAIPVDGDLGAGVIARGIGGRIVRATQDRAVSAALTRINMALTRPEQSSNLQRDPRTFARLSA